MEWRAFCDRLAALGDLIAAEPYPTDELARIEGERYLARLTSFALQQATDFDDPAFPVLYRLNDDVTKWAGPNVDNVYLAAAISPEHTYRLTGDLSRSRGVIVQVLHGWWGQDDFRVCDDFTFDGDVVLGEGGRPLADDADRLFVREYLVDWGADRRPGLSLERLGEEPRHPAPPDPAAALDRAMAWLELNIPFWQSLEHGMRAFLEPNTFGRPYQTPLGGGEIWYGNGRIAAEPDQAVVLEWVVPDARYWSLQLYNPGWYESLDFRNRQTALNDASTFVDADGVARFVVSERDPGTPNWLDLAGHPEVLVHQRAIWCPAGPERIRTRVVPIDGVRGAMPAAHPVVSDHDRAAALAVRRKAVGDRLRR